MMQPSPGVIEKARPIEQIKCQYIKVTTLHENFSREQVLPQSVLQEDPNPRLYFF